VENINRRIPTYGCKGINARLYVKITKKQTELEDMVQVVELLPSKYKAMNSNPSTTKMKIIILCSQNAIYISKSFDN
jgi:hypothetical protein